MSTTISFRIEEAKRDELDEIARFLDHDRTYVLNEAVDLYLENRRWQLERLRLGTEAADRGQTRSQAEVKRHMADYMQRARKAKGKS
jgi:predicted transcriptional regulator